MELRQLRYFAVLAKELHFRRAAQRLHIAQPGLSQQIKAIEKELGVALFTREGGVALTPAGQALAAEAATLINRFDLLVERTQSVGRGQSGQVTVSFSRSIGSDVSQELLDPFSLKFPSIEIKLQSAWTDRNVELLRSQEIDIGFIQFPVDDSLGLHTVRMGSLPLTLAIPASRSGEGWTEKKILDEMPLVHWPRELAPGHYDYLMRVLWGADSGDHEVIEFPDAEHILPQVGAGRGFAVLERARARRLKPDNVVLVDFDRAEQPTLTWGLGCLEETNNPSAMRLMRFAEEQSQQFRESE